MSKLYQRFAAHVPKDTGTATALRSLSCARRYSTVRSNCTVADSEKVRQHISLRYAYSRWLCLKPGSPDAQFLISLECVSPVQVTEPLLVQSTATAVALVGARGNDRRQQATLMWHVASGRSTPGHLITDTGPKHVYNFTSLERLAGTIRFIACTTTCSQ